MTFFSPIVAALSACFGRFDGLGVQDADGRLRVAIQRLSRQFAQRIIDGDEGSITTPCVERGANRTQRRNIRWKQASLAASTMFGDQRVDNRVHIDPGKAQRRDAARAVIARRGAAMPRPDPAPLRRRSDSGIASCFMRRLNDDTSDVWVTPIPG